MIPKVIHYCWFGRKPLPKDAIKCIASWEKYCPDYEIKEWNEENFDINICKYVKEAYEEKKWAFVSDYARFYILYNYGGVYFDTDVELLKPIDDIVVKGNFMGVESLNPIYVAPGLGLGANKGIKFYKEILDFYRTRNFRNNDGSLDLTTVVVYVTKLLKTYGLKDKKEVQKIADIYIYPVEYFCPKDVTTGELCITDNTYSIHHFKGSWVTKSTKIKYWIKRTLLKILGENKFMIIKEVFVKKK